jgi:hypothetical protein
MDTDDVSLQNGVLYPVLVDSVIKCKILLTCGYFRGYKLKQQVAGCA